MNEDKITAQQIKLIKTMQSKARLDDNQYRYWLKRMFKKSSCTELTYQEAVTFIRRLRQFYDKVNRNINTERITYKQVQTIRSLWKQVTFLPPEQQEAGLRKFLLRQCGVEEVTWISRLDAPSVICALRTMLLNKEKEENERDEQ